MHIELLQWKPDAEGAGCWQISGAGPAAGSFTASVVLYAGSSDRLSREPIYASLRARYPDALIAGCSSGTPTLDTEPDDEMIAACAIGLERSRVRGVSLSISDPAESRHCGTRLAELLRTDPGSAELALVLVLSDGLGVNGAQLAEGLSLALGPQVCIAGGLAGDGARFKITLVGLDGPPTSGQVAAIGFYGTALRRSAAAVGGWDSFGPARQVTRASGNVLFELDGRPALDLYEHYLGDEAEDLPGSALLYPLRVWNPQHPDSDVVRTVLAIDRDAGSMTFAGDIPPGWSAQLMRGRHERLVLGAERAADRASAELFRPADAQHDSPSATLALLVSCVGRRLVMGQRTSDEVEAVHDVLQTRLGTGARLFGFYSYGELAPRAGSGRCELHNQTMTVTLLTEDMA